MTAKGKKMNDIISICGIHLNGELTNSNSRSNVKNVI